MRYVGTNNGEARKGRKKEKRKKGYNLIRMRIVSGYLPVNVRDYYRVEMLPGCITLPRLK